MFLDLETERGEKLTINSNSIVAYWPVKRCKACVLLINDITYTLNCSYEELQDRLSGKTAVTNDEI